jgi:hypothetical protein
MSIAGHPPAVNRVPHVAAAGRIRFVLALVLAFTLLILASPTLKVAAQQSENPTPLEVTDSNA